MVVRGGRVDKNRDEFSLNVSHETSGYYIGVREGDGLKPSRISAEHWRTAADAEEALLVGNWSVRPLEAGVTPADRSAAQERIAYAQNKILEREASGAVRVPIERKKEMKETPAQQLESRQDSARRGLSSVVATRRTAVLAENAPKSMDTRRVLLASLVGSAIEWFDFFLYGTATSLVFDALFFPTADPLVSLMLAYLSFALPFFIRPIGGIVFAHIGDRIGRKKTLILTLTLMGVGTTLIGLLPTYAMIGVTAPVLLMVLRLLQGLGLGGEWGGAVLLAFEFAPSERRGFFGSIPQAGIPFGMVLASVCVACASLLPEPAFIAWGWRVPFVFSSGLVVLGLWIRNGIDETPDFKSLKSCGKIARYPVLELLRNYWPRVITAILVKFGETSSFYVFAVFLVSYATKELGYSKDVTLLAIATGALVAALFIPMCGALADRFGRRPIFVVGSLGLIMIAGPFFWRASQRSTLLLFAATVLAIGLVWPLVTATLSTLLAETFPAEVRYSGITFGYQIGAALVGGTAPLIATLLLTADQGRWRWIATFIALSAGVSLTVVSGAGASSAGRRLADNLHRI